MKKPSNLQKIYLITAILFALLFLFIRKQPFEYFMLISLGILIGSIFERKIKIVLVVSLFVWFIATFFDPIMKPILDELFNLNTVGFSLVSIFVNSILLMLFWIGFYIGKKYHWGRGY